MIEYEYEHLFQEDTVHKDFTIGFSGGVITNDDLHEQDIELTERLCSENQLRFGSCEAGVLKFPVSNIVLPLKGKELDVKIILKHDENTLFQLGKYKVHSDKPNADRNYRNIEAYDAMHDIISSDVASWYNGLTFPMTLKEFRTAFLSHFSIEAEEVVLCNDEMAVERTVDAESLSGKDVVTAICEINGCFGHIGRGGKFRYIVLEEYRPGLYPGNTTYPSNTLYPTNSNATSILKKQYIDCEYEDYVVEKITGLQIRQEEDDIGCFVGAADNVYIIQNNFLVYGKNAEELETIAKNLLSVINKVTYRPFNVELKGNPCFEVGDLVAFSGKREKVQSYILERTIKGLQALRDSFVAEGSEHYSEDINSTNRQIAQLKGKTNLLIRTVDETKSTIANVEKGLQTQITQNAEGIKAEATRAENAEEQLRSSISISAEQIKSEVSATYSTKTETSSVINNAVKTASDDATSKANAAEANANSATDNKLKSYSTTTQMNSAIEQKANNILVSVNEEITETRTYIYGQVEILNTELSASIKLNSDAITSEVSRAQNAETQLSTRITQTESGFNAQIQSIDGRVTELNADLNSVTSKISGYDGRFNRIEQTIEGVTFQDENGVTKISGNVISTGTLIGVTALFTEHHSLFWACGTDSIAVARSVAEWGCDSNAIFAHDANGKRSIEIERLTGNGVFYGDVIVIASTRNISLINAYDLADSAKSLANSNYNSINSLQTSVSDINKDISSIESDISEVKSDISTNKTSILTLENHVGNLISTIPGLDSRISENAKNVAVHDKYFSGIFSRLDAIEAQLGID